MFEEFLTSIALSKVDLDGIHKAHSELDSLPTENMYSLLTAFSIYIQTKKSNKARATDGLLAKSTALGYIEERNLRANVQTNGAPGCNVDDLSVLVGYLIAKADVATGLKSVHDAALLTMMWHTFGRAVDTCFARKQQLSISASGVSIYKAPERWQQCMLHAFELLFICYDAPSEYLFPLAPNFAESDLPGNKPYSQEETPPRKRKRKRPTIASYITEVIRDSLKSMPPALSQTVAPNMASHSIRRGAAAYANASPKLSIQWISSCGTWLLESLTKAFAY
eukprot:jgi/Phyca11/107488/e_gw1.13.744.1